MNFTLYVWDDWESHYRAYWDDIDAVSYTHLDVYKRQVTFPALANVFYSAAWLFQSQTLVFSV